ncbi:MAG TPA: hypothetical protein VJL78_08245 [Candidatus Nitrosocosmicus sp.]|nr:hypothetical protein [Candidatus Nitrosocosmicus sp.]
MAFIYVQSKKYNTKTKGQDEKKKNKDILYSGSKKKKQHTYRVKNLHSKNKLGLL